MNAFYKIKYYVDCDPQEDVGVVVAEDEGEMMLRLKKYYGDFDEVTIRFNENYESDVIPQEDFVSGTKFNT